MNDIENVWNRILEHCSLNVGEPIDSFKTKLKKYFYIIKINDETVRVYLLESDDEEWTISKKQLNQNLLEGHPRENELVSSYLGTAQSYQYGLFHDGRIYLKK